MAFREDLPRVAEASTVTGTGAASVTGAIPGGYKRFSDFLSVGDTFLGAAVADDGTWQEGLFTYSGANQVTFTAITNSSSGTSQVSFAAGSKVIFAGIPSVGRVLANVAAKSALLAGDKLAMLDSAASNALKIVLLSDLITSIQGDGSSAASAGYRGMPQGGSVSADRTFALADMGKSIYHPASDTTGRTWTIPANGTVAFPIGAAITVDNDAGAGAITLAIDTDTLVQVGTGSTGSRTIASGGMATFWKVTATRWRVNGTGLT